MELTGVLSAQRLPKVLQLTPDHRIFGKRSQGYVHLRNLCELEEVTRKLTTKSIAWELDEGEEFESNASSTDGESAERETPTCESGVDLSCQ